MNYDILVSLVYVIIGGFISIATNYCSERQKEKKEIRFKYHENLKETYVEFLTLHQKIKTRNLYDVLQTKKSCNDDREFLELNERVKAKVEFYFPQNLREITYVINSISNPKSEDEAQKYDSVRSEKMEQLNTELRKIIFIDNLNK